MGVKICDIFLIVIICPLTTKNYNYVCELKYNTKTTIKYNFKA